MKPKEGTVTIDIATYDEYTALEREILRIKTEEKQEENVLRGILALWVFEIHQTHDKAFQEKAEDTLTKAGYSVELKDHTGVMRFGKGPQRIILYK